MSPQINLKSRNFEAVTWPKFKKTQTHPSGLVSYKKNIGFNITGIWGCHCSTDLLIMTKNIIKQDQIFSDNVL